MQHDSLTLKQEKDSLKEITELKKSRPKVATVREMESAITTDDRTPAREKIKALNEQMAEYYKEKKKVSEQITELTTARSEQTGDLPALQTDLDDIFKKITEKKTERSQIKADYRQEQQKFYEYQSEIRRIRQDRAGEERRARQAEYEKRQKEKRAEKLDDQPQVAEITLIEQTLLF